MTDALKSINPGNEHYANRVEYYVHNYYPARIVKWHVARGDFVRPGHLLADFAPPDPPGRRVDHSLFAHTSGYVVARYAEINECVARGQRLLAIGASPDGTAAPPARGAVTAILWVAALLPGRVIAVIAALALAFSGMALRRVQLLTRRSRNLIETATDRFLLSGKRLCRAIGRIVVLYFRLICSFSCDQTLDELSRAPGCSSRLFFLRPADPWFRVEPDMLDELVAAAREARHLHLRLAWPRHWMTDQGLSAQQLRQLFHAHLWSRGFPPRLLDLLRYGPLVQQRLEFIVRSRWAYEQVIYFASLVEKIRNGQTGFFQAIDRWLEDNKDRDEELAACARRLFDAGRAGLALLEEKRRAEEERRRLWREVEEWRNQREAELRKWEALCAQQRADRAAAQCTSQRLQEARALKITLVAQINELSPYCANLQRLAGAVYSDERTRAEQRLRALEDALRETDAFLEGSET